MKESSSYQLAVIGRNVPAALWLMAAQRRAPELSLSWIRTEQERITTDKQNPFWLLLPESLYKECRNDVPAIKAPEAFVFLQRGRRLRLSDFRSQGDSRNPDLVRAPIRDKLTATAMWSDLSPSLWGRHGLKAHEPDVSWVNQRPVCLGGQEPENFYLVPHRLALEALEKKLAELGVDVGNEDLGAVGVETGRRNERHRIIHNAPRGFSEANAVLWTSIQGLLKDEGVPVPRSHWRPMRAPRARWISRGAWVSEASVTGLSTFSIWLEPGARERFFATGQMESRTLRRVICLPASFCGSRAETFWLQIDELEWDHAAPSTRAFDETEKAPYVPQFLFEVCPLLKTQSAVFTERLLDENHLFDDARAVTHRIAQNMDFWFNGTLGSPASYFEDWKQRHLRRRPRADKIPAP